MAQKIIAGNWKMNGSKANIVTLLETLKKQLSGTFACQTVVLSPFIYLPLVAEMLQGSTVAQNSNIAYGAQTLSEFTSGAYTGETSAAMLVDMGCQYVIVGHSERRQLFGETDQAVAKKFASAVNQKLTPILCIGETQEERAQGLAQQVVRRQLTAVLEWVGNDVFQKCVIAYEPIWAIGTGNTATPEQAQAMHADIRAILAEHDSAMAPKLSILYGGSVKSSNAEALFKMPDIDGALVGGASLDAQEFVKIVQAMRS